MWVRKIEWGMKMNERNESIKDFLRQSFLFLPEEKKKKKQFSIEYIFDL